MIIIKIHKKYIEYFKIPNLLLNNYSIDRSGSILDLNTNTYVEITYQDKKGYVYLNGKKYYIGELMLKTFIGDINLPIIEKYGYKFSSIDNFEYQIDDITYLKDDIIIKGKLFKRLFTSNIYVSSDGILYDNAKHRFKRKSYNEKGYLTMSMHNAYYSNSGYKINRIMKINRLVWVVWKGIIPEGYEINHIDHNRWNNKLDNLECITKKENLTDAMINCGYKSLTENDVAKILDLYYSGIKIIDIDKILNIPHSNIQMITSGRSWKNFHKKYLMDRNMCSTTIES